MPALALAENPRTAAKAAIKRASKKSRVDLRKLDRESRQELTRIYRQAVEDLGRSIDNHADNGESVRLEQLQNLLGQVTARLETLENSKSDLLGRSLKAGADLGVEPLAVDVATIGAPLPRVANDAVQFVTNFIAGDGLQLSDRVWRNNRHARRVVQEAIEQAVIQGHSASQAAADLLAAGRPVPRDLQNKIGQAAAGKIGNQVGTDLFSGLNSPYKNALRLFRTEINRAHGEAYHAAAFEHPDVIGTRFLLSPNHPERDICDMHASVNRYGLGAGVYPKNRNPWPAHPNTLSFTEVVFDDEVSEADRSGKQNRIDWLIGQSPETQALVLNSVKKSQALRLGLLKEPQIATPWQVLKPRFVRAGHDPDRWGELLQNRIVSAPTVPRNSAASRAPVSNALELVGYKSILDPLMDTIDKVHDDGNLPKIPIKRNASRKTYGSYYHLTGGGPTKITISQYGDHKELTAAHEIGHFLDHQGIGKKHQFSSKNDDIFEGWRKAVLSSDAIRTLKKVERGPSIADVGEGNRWLVNKPYVRYLLKTHEIWARSYAQYIALRGDHGGLKTQIKALQDNQLTSKVSMPSQWDDDDFEPIAREIDKLFKGLGWIK